MRSTLLAILLIGSTAYAIDPKYRAMNESQLKRVNPAILQEQLFQARDELCDLFWNRDWFIEEVERYARTGVKPKTKVPFGLHVDYFAHSNKGVVESHMANVGDAMIAVHVAKGKGGFYKGTMWIDTNVIPYDVVRDERKPAIQRARDRAAR